MLEFVRANGSLVRYTKGDQDESKMGILDGCRIHLGCLGIISTLTLDVLPYYEVEAVRYDKVPLQKMIDHLPHLWTTCDSLSVWTTGFGKGRGMGQCWMAFRHFVHPSSDRSVAHVEPSNEVLGKTGIRNDCSMHRYCSDPQQPSVPFTPTTRGPWHDVLTLTLHDGQETDMSIVDFQAEFFVPLELAQKALQVVWDVAKDWTFSSPHHGYDGADGPQKGLVDAMEFRQVKSRTEMVDG